MKKCKSRHTAAEMRTLLELIRRFLHDVEPCNYEEMLIMAVLFEIEKDISKKVADRFKLKHSLILNPSKSVAMLLFLNEVIEDTAVPTYYTALVHKIRNSIASHYPLKVYQ